MDSAEQFKAELTALIPFLRAFARSLSGGNAAEADDVTQEAMMRAWAAREQFEPGTNLKAWAFRILRNTFLSGKRRDRNTTHFDPEAHDHLLTQQPVGNAALELDELRRALLLLDVEQREALILVGAGGCSYDEAAEICGVPAGTVKSRVSRGRDRLAGLLAGDQVRKSPSRGGDPMADIYGQATKLKVQGPTLGDQPRMPRAAIGTAAKQHRKRLKTRLNPSSVT